MSTLVGEGRQVGVEQLGETAAERESAFFEACGIEILCACERYCSYNYKDGYYVPFHIMIGVYQSTKFAKFFELCKRICGNYLFLYAQKGVPLPPILLEDVPHE